MKEQMSHSTELPPQREGQGHTMLITCSDSAGHWFSPDAVREQIAAAVAAERERLQAWAVDRWNAEVQNRPLVNKYRRALDDSWRQVIRFSGGDPDVLLGPSHDVLARDFGVAP